MIIIMMLELYVNLLTISTGLTGSSSDKLHQFPGFSIDSWLQILAGGFNDRVLCEDIHNVD